MFYVNVPIGLVTLVLAARRLPSGTPSGWRRSELDLVGSLLLGGGVFALLLPLVSAEAGGIRRLWWLFGAAVALLVGFAAWEVRTARGGRQPLLEPGLTRTRGYPAGSGIGLVYFVGFTGIWLVLALYFQDGLGYSPLRSGLAVTPFALGVAVSSPIAGRIVPHAGRWVTVSGLAGVTAGLATTALVLRYADGTAATWLSLGPLLIAGLGGGMVTTPNITLTLQHVPVRMAGAAGGALQTAQRIGSAVGTAVLATVFYQTLIRTDRDYPVAVSDALLLACGVMLVALGMAVTELVRRRPPPPKRHPEHCVHHI